jgi:hypothetical protein
MRIGEDVAKKRIAETQALLAWCWHMWLLWLCVALVPFLKKQTEQRAGRFTALIKQALCCWVLHCCWYPFCFRMWEFHAIFYGINLMVPEF